MEEKLIEYSDKIIEALEAGVDFAGEQAPLLIQEVLAYYGLMGLTWSVFFLIITISTIYFGIKLIKSASKQNDEDGIALGGDTYYCIWWYFYYFIYFKLFNIYPNTNSASSIFNRKTQ